MTLADYRKKQGLPEIPEGHEDEHAEHHPSALEYAQIGIILAIITSIEVALYYIELDYTLLVITLIILSAVKFMLVVLWFMHLKFDNNLFSWFFFGAMALTFAVFAAALATIGGKLV